MRINKFVAQASGMSRRTADAVLAERRVRVNGQLSLVGQQVRASDHVTLDGKPISPTAQLTTIMLNKPVGYVCSRVGQGSKTIYDLLPEELHHLKSVGRLDKDSSGLLLLTNDGQLANQLTHPSFQKEKVYELELDKPLAQPDFEAITKTGVDIGDDRPSRFQLAACSVQHAISKDAYRIPLTAYRWKASLSEGRNHQIRRTFAALDYHVIKLHRTQFGSYSLAGVKQGQYQQTIPREQ